MLLEDGDYVIKIPLFKFLEQQYTDALINLGCVRLTKISEFRNSAKYSNKIHDPQEGILEIKNHFDFFKGLAKDGTGLIPFMFQPDTPVECINGVLSCNLKIDDVLLYCTSGELFSGSMIQAFEDQKDSCVLIKDTNRFFQIISSKCPHLNYLGNRYCDYTVGKQLFEKNPPRNSDTEKVLKNPLQSIWFKPKDYVNQIENRAAWNSRYNHHLESLNVVDEVLRDTVIEINLGNINKETLRNAENSAMGVIVHHTNGCITTLTMQRPNKIICPVINYRKDETRPFLGFLCDVPDRRVTDVNINTTHIVQSAFSFSKHGAVVINTFLDEVQKISFYTMDDPVKLRKEFMSLFIGKLLCEFNGVTYNINVSSFDDEDIPRYIIHFDEDFEDTEFSILVISKIDGIWKCRGRSDIQNNDLAIAVGKVIDFYFTKFEKNEFKNNNPG